MTPDPYAPCPCGSGKKFKWCCQPIYAGIHYAQEQAAAGQLEAALRTLEAMAREHAGNPEVWGQKARLLYYGQRKAEEAEAALQKAFDLNPNYPFGLLLRASFRFQEGELPGALLLARRAADAYDPEARDHLAEAYHIIFECERRRQRPLAARAALRLVTHYQPADEEARATFDALFGEQGPLPWSARREYAFKSPPAAASGARRAAWDNALKSAGARLSEPARAFEALLKAVPDDAPALFNLGLARAWLGDNKGALEALDRYLDLEPDEAAATAAAALAEVLRCGQGLEDEGDYREHGFVYQVRNPEGLNGLLRDWGGAGRLLVTHMPDEQEKVFHALVLEAPTAALIPVGGPAAEAGHLAGSLTIAGNLVQFTTPLKGPFERVREELRARLQLGLGELREGKGPIAFHDVVAEALLFPVGGAPGLSAERVREHTQRYYEDKWAHQPRKVLGGLTPVDAAGHAKLRKKLRGVIQFIQECAAPTVVGDYDFERLRRKLGLSAPAAPAAPGAVPADISALGAAELAALPADALSDEQLEQAYQAAHRLSAEEVSAHFARALVGRPPQAGRTDRYPWYSYLINKALKDGALDDALDTLNEAEKADCEHNEGRRRNDYELRRGQVHVKRGEVDQAQDVFQGLIARAPANFKYRGAAAEAMMSAKQGARALRFAEEGLAAARQANDRDSEQYLMDLVAAAKRQVG
jgi:tetratricopeptide (TPR) repeat protein